MNTDPHQPDPVGRRVETRLILGLVAGPIAGALIGLLVGALVFGWASRGMWAALVAGAVFGALGGFVAGMSALGPPAPADDPLPRRESDDGLTEQSRPERDDADRRR